MEDEEYTCDIETIELKNLILVWLTECENYLKNRDLSYTRPSPPPLQDGLGLVYVHIQIIICIVSWVPF